MVHPDNIVQDDGVLNPEIVNVNNDPVIDATPMINAVDVRQHFTNDRSFGSREQLIDLVRKEANKHGFGIVILRSDNGNSRRKAFVILNCERDGSYVQSNRVLKHDDTGSRKCGCPFKLRATRRVDDLWRFNVICGMHNHALDVKLHGHPMACRLSREERNVTSDLMIVKVAPRNILADLKRKKLDSVSNIKQIYNERHNLKVLNMGPRSEMQQLLKLLGDNNYVSSFRTSEDKVTMRDIFWTHPESIKLFNTFPTVLVMDLMYKTNKYRLPLLEIVGVTSTDKTYSVGFAFLECEKEENFMWALGICKSLLVDQEVMPNVVVTDRDNALMNAVDTVFPTSTALLCRYHITCNVRSKLKPAVGTKDRLDENGKFVKAGVVVDRIMAAWRGILDAYSEEDYTEKLVHFRSLCGSIRTFCHYVESTILDKVREKVVCAWTNRVRHLGCTTTNRVESAHAVFKRWLGDSKGDLCRGWDTVNQMLDNQHNEIQTSFGRSKTVMEHRYKGPILFSHLIYNISRTGLNFLFHEANRSETTGTDSSLCGCTIRTTYGLPCACILAKKKILNSPIRMDEVADHWKKLRFDDFAPPKENDSKITISDELEVIMEKFAKADDTTKLHIKEQLRKIAFPETTDLKPPSQPIKTKGAPKKSKITQDDNSTKRAPSYFEHVDSSLPEIQETPKPKCSGNKGARISKPPRTPPIKKSPIVYIDEMPLFMHKYIDNIVDVGGDGNCGYRTVAVLLGKGENNHTLVRRELIAELTSYRDIYGRLYENQEKFAKIHDALVPSLTGIAPVSKWMSFPEMGHLIASAYDMVCVDLTRFGLCETFFPLHSRPPLDASGRVICIGYLRSRHFVQVFLKPGCPIPATSCQWTAHRSNEAETWPDPFVARMAGFEEMMSKEREQNRERSKNVPILDLGSTDWFGEF